MEAEKLAKQMISFQKTSFNHTFDMVMAFWDQSEKITCAWCKKNGLFPDQNMKVMGEWGHAVKQSLENCKKLIDEGFDTMESCFNLSGNCFQGLINPGSETTANKKPAEKNAEPGEEKQ